MIDTSQTSERTPSPSSASPALLARVQAAIEGLPVDQRLALALRKGLGMPYWQIAKVLQCNEAKAREATYAAIRTLQSRFANELSTADLEPAQATGQAQRMLPMKGAT